MAILLALMLLALPLMAQEPDADEAPIFPETIAPRSVALPPPRVLLPFRGEDGRWGLMTPDGEIALPAEYKRVTGLAPATLKERKWQSVRSLGGGPNYPDLPRRDYRKPPPDKRMQLMVTVRLGDDGETEIYELRDSACQVHATLNKHWYPHLHNDTHSFYATDSELRMIPHPRLMTAYVNDFFVCWATEDDNSPIEIYSPKGKRLATARAVRCSPRPGTFWLGQVEPDGPRVELADLPFRLQGPGTDMYLHFAVHFPIMLTPEIDLIVRHDDKQAFLYHGPTGHLQKVGQPDETTQFRAMLDRYSRTGLPPQVAVAQPVGEEPVILLGFADHLAAYDTRARPLWQLDGLRGKWYFNRGLTPDHRFIEYDDPTDKKLPAYALISLNGFLISGAEGVSYIGDGFARIHRQPMSSDLVRIQGLNIRHYQNFEFKVVRPHLDQHEDDLQDRTYLNIRFPGEDGYTYLMIGRDDEIILAPDVIDLYVMAVLPPEITGLEQFLFHVVDHQQDIARLIQADGTVLLTYPAGEALLDHAPPGLGLLAFKIDRDDDPFEVKILRYYDLKRQQWLPWPYRDGHIVDDLFYVRDDSDDWGYRRIDGTWLYRYKPAP